MRIHRTLLIASFLALSVGCAAFQKASDPASTPEETAAAETEIQDKTEALASVVPFPWNLVVGAGGAGLILVATTLRNIRAGQPQP